MLGIDSVRPRDTSHERHRERDAAKIAVVVSSATWYLSVRLSGRGFYDAQNHNNEPDAGTGGARKYKTATSSAVITQVVPVKPKPEVVREVIGSGPPIVVARS
jgi:hypothetical protein